MVVKLRTLVTNPMILTPVMVFGFLTAWFTANLLRFGDPFRKLFPPTCIYLPDEEVGPTLVVFLFALGLATACFVTMFRRYAGLRLFTLRALIALMAFALGLFLTL